MRLMCASLARTTRHVLSMISRLVLNDVRVARITLAGVTSILRSAAKRKARMASNEAHSLHK